MNKKHFVVNILHIFADIKQLNRHTEQITDKMEEIERKVYKLIVLMTRQKLAKELDMDHRTLMSRIEKGGWLKKEIEIIEHLSA